VLAERLRSDWQDARRAADRAGLLAVAEASAADSEAIVEATVLNLHGFYGGVERILEWLARELDGGVPRGAAWHRDLLDQMALDVPLARPAFLSGASRGQLEEYLRFRHLVRNLYTWDYDPLKVHQLTDRLPALVALIEADVARFSAFLEAAARADTGEG